MATFPRRVVAWERIDAAVAEAILKTGGASRRAIQSMIDIAAQNGGGGGGGITASDRALLPAVVRREPADEAAPTATNWPVRPDGFAAVFWVGAAPRPAEMDTGDIHFLPPAESGSTSTTTFTQPDGSAWPTPWTLERVPTGGGATVTSGMGRLTSGATGGRNTTDTAAIRYGDPAVDTEAVLRFRLITDDPQVSLVLRSDRASLDPSTGVVVTLTKGQLTASNVQSSTYSTIGAVAKTHTVGTDYGLRVQLVGSTLNARTWPSSQPEPSGWDITGQVAATNGYAGLTVGSSTAAAAQTAAFDDIQFTAAGASGYGSAYGVAYGM